VENNLYPSPLLSVRRGEMVCQHIFRYISQPRGFGADRLSSFKLSRRLCLDVFHKKKRTVYLNLSGARYFCLRPVRTKYPFNGRVLLFIVPALLLLIAQGAEQIRVLTAGRSTFVGACFLVLLFFHPLFFSTYACSSRTPTVFP